MSTTLSKGAANQKRLGNTALRIGLFQEFTDKFNRFTISKSIFRYFLCFITLLHFVPKYRGLKNAAKENNFLVKHKKVLKFGKI